MSVTHFLDTSRRKKELANALDVLREFKGHESLKEYVGIPFDAWAKFEQLEEFLAHLVDGDPLKDDTLEYINLLIKGDEDESNDVEEVFLKIEGYYNMVFSYDIPKASGGFSGWGKVRKAYDDLILDIDSELNSRYSLIRNGDDRAMRSPSIVFFLQPKDLFNPDGYVDLDWNIYSSDENGDADSIIEQIKIRVNFSIS